MVVSGRTVLLALVGALLAAWSAPAVGWFALALLVAFAADLALAGPISRARITRDPIAPVRLGARATSVLVLGNESSRELRALVRDAWVPSAGARPRSRRVDVPAGQTRRIDTTLVPTRRGEREADRVTVRSYGPIGLGARQRRVDVPGRLQVLPPFASRRFLPEKLSRLRRLDGAVLVRQRGQGSEFDSLRAYVDGDDARSVDWRATARSRDLVVRTWRPERDRQVVLAIDTGRTSAARLGDEPRLDAALDSCLLLGALAARAGDRVALVAGDVAVRARLAPTSGHDVLPRLVTALAPLEASLVETDPQLLVAEVLRQTRRRSLVVVFSSLDAAPTGGDTADGLLAAVRQLAVRHEVVVASASDPELARFAANRADSAESYVAAAAELSTAARAAVVEQLSTLGVVVVDAPSDVLASRVADAYLDLKAAGRL